VKPNSGQEKTRKERNKIFQLKFQIMIANKIKTH
jgi:hypothetical protein